MAPHQSRVSAPTGAPPTPEDPTAPVGPNPGQIIIADQYTLEQKLRKRLSDNGCDPAREDTYRLQGVQLIDNVREALHLPVRTFDTASNYYHMFRLSFRDAEYNYQDAALASLFVACKVEDTIKKSKEILCAAHNLKYPDHPLAQDDKTFEGPSKIIIGLERLILETIAFDFRTRHPEKLLVKVVKRVLGKEDAGYHFFELAYYMSIDIYKTFAPIKQTTFTMVMAIIELTALVTDQHVDRIKGLDPSEYHTTRACMLETMLDLLDLYTQFPKSTKLGTRLPLDKFIEVKIQINKELEDRKLPRFQLWCEKCDQEGKDRYLITPGSATSPATTGSYPGIGPVKRGPRGNETTMRFVFDAEEAREEMEIVNEYFKEEFEEYEIEVEEPIPENEHPRSGRNHPRHGHNHRDQGWSPYQRNRHGHHDRHKGRKGGGHGGYY